MKLWYYRIICHDGYTDVMASDRKLGPGCMNGTPEEIPDAKGRLHRVRAVHPASKRNFMAAKRRAS